MVPPTAGGGGSVGGTTGTEMVEEIVAAWSARGPIRQPLTGMRDLDQVASLTRVPNAAYQVACLVEIQVIGTVAANGHPWNP